MSGIRVISATAIDWPRVSRLAKALGMFAAITLAGCATQGSGPNQVLDQAVLQGVQAGLRSGPEAGVAAGVGTAIKGGTGEVTRATNRTVNRSVNQATR